MTQSVSPVRRLRRMLVLSSALGTTTLGGLVAPAQAQNIPTRADVVRTQTNPFGLDPQITNSDGNLNVNLRANSTVIDWNGFNIPENKTANFDKSGFVLGNAAVLNRDVSGNASQLLGKLTSDPSVAVWVYNPNGILVGANASFNTGSLVLSTLDVNNGDFVGGSSNYRLSTSSNSSAGITVLNGAQIRVAGGNRGLVMVAPKIDAQGDFQAGSQNVAFVTATDVTLSYATNSPLSVTINRGTAVSGRSQYVRGSVGGRDALFALASQATVTDALLQVDADVTTATMGTRGIVLSAGKPANAVDGVTIGGTTADTGGVVNLVAGGGLTVEDQDGSDILAGASGSASFAGALSSQRDVVLAAGGALTVAGTVAADRDYLVSGGGVALGNGTAVSQQAGRGVGIVSRNGDLTGAANLTLRSGGGTGILLSTTGTAAGDILFDPSSRLTGGDNRQGYVDIVRRSPGNAVALGNVAGRALRQGIGNGAVTNGLTTGGTLVVGDIDVRDSLSLNVSGLIAGALASDNGVTIVSNGTLAARSVLARNGAVALSGNGATMVFGAIAANGGFNDLTITRNGPVSVQALSATRDVTIDAGSGTAAITGAVAAGMQYNVSGSGVTLGGGQSVTQSAKDGVTITAGAGGITGASGLTLQSNSDSFGGADLTLALTAASTTGIAFATDTTLLAGPVGQSDMAVQLADRASPIALGGVQARNLTGLDTGGALRVGAVSVAGDLVARGATIQAGDLSSSGGQVALTATSGALSAGTVNAADGITVTGAQAVTIGGLGAGDDIALTGQGTVTIGGGVLAGGAVTLQGASLGLAGGQLTGGGAIDLRATSGGIASTGALAIGSTSRRSSDFIRLQAGGADGIVLAQGSAITAGGNQALRVGIFNGSTDAPLRLGDVTARSLTALAAAGGDATQAGGAIVSNGSLSFGRLNLVDGFAAESLNGDLSVGQLAVTGNGQGISLRAAKGTLGVQDSLSTDGDVTLVSGAALTLGTVASRSGRATLNSAGAVTLSNLSGALGVSASGTQLAIDTVTGGPVALTATAGGINVGGIGGTSVSAVASGGDLTIRNAVNASDAVSLSASGNIGIGGGVTGAGVTIGAQGDASLQGGVQAQGDVAISGRSVTLGGVNRATGGYGVTATGGGITGATGTTILSDSDGKGGEGLSLAATGDIAFDPTGSLGGGTGTAAVTLTTSGGAIGVGDVTATSFTANGASSIRTGRLTLGNGVSLAAAGGVGTGAITVASGGVAIDAGSGVLSTGSIDAGSGAVTLSGGTVSFGTVGATALTATATGGLTGGAITTQGDTRLRGGGITVGDIGAANLAATATAGALGLGELTIGGVATLNGGDIGFGRVNAASLAANAAGALQGGDIATSGAANLSAAGTLNLGRIDSGGAVTIGGTAVTTGNVDAASLTATASSGALVAGDVTTGDAATITAKQGSIDLGVVATTRGDVTIASGGRLNAVGITAGGAATLSSAGTNADILLADGLDAVGSASVSATGNVRAPFIRSRTGDLTIAAPNGELAGFDSGTGVALGAGPGRAFSLTIGTAARLGDVIGGKLTVIATSISTGRVDTSGEALELRATAGDLTVSGPVSGGTVTLGASGRTSLGDVTATGPLALSGSTIGFGNLAASSIGVTAAGAVNGGTVQSGGATTIGGTSIGLTQLSGSGPVALTATAGDLVLAGPVTGTDVTLAASGRAALASVTANGTLAITGGSVGFGDLAGASVNVGSTGAVDGNTVRATSAASVSGGNVTLTQISGGAVALTATAGDLVLAGPVTGTDVTLGASGRAGLGAVTATGALRMRGAAIVFGDVAGTSVDGQSDGAITGNAVRAAGALSLRGAGDLTVNTLSSGGDAVLTAGGAARIAGAVASGGGYRVTGSSVTLGGTDGIVQTAAADVRVTATAGDVTGGRGLTLVSDADGTGAEPLVLDAAGQIGFAGTLLRARPGGGAVLGLRAGGGQAITLGSVEASRIGRFDGSVVATTLTHDASLTTGDLAVGDLSIGLTRGDLSLGRISATGTTALRTDAGAMTLGDLSAGGVDLASAGALTTGAVSSGGAASLTGDRIDVGGRLSAARQLLAQARSALTLRDVGAGGAVTLQAGDALSAGSVEGASIAATGAGLTVTSAKAGDTLALTSSRDLALNGGTAGGSATLDVAGLATIGNLAAGPSVTVTAGDVALGGPLRAQTVAFVNRAPGTTTLRIGDGTGADGFRLSDAEVQQVSADTLRFDAGSGAMEVGALTLGSTSGRSVAMQSTGDIRVTGAVTAQGTGRSIRIGGGTDSGNAASIQVVTTREGGGRLLFDGSDVELRGDRIAVGLARGFIDTLQPGTAGLAQAQALIGNGNSTLYNPQLGGGFYDPAATTTLSARSLTVRFGDYALFQNTAVPGEFSGLTLGGTPGAPVSPALRVSSFGKPGQGGIALFGTINGISGASAALLGNPVISIDPSLLPTSRINGCLVGSGAGCVTTIVIQPTLQVFHWNSEEVFGISRDVAVPFSPVIGANNEELLSELPALAPESPQDRKGE